MASDLTPPKSAAKAASNTQVAPASAPRADYATRFQPGNQAAAGVKHTNRRMMTQQLISILNEEFQDYDPKTGRFKKGTGQPITKMRRLLDNLVFNGTVLGDTLAIKEVFDRVEGKAVQAIQLGADENSGGKVIIHLLPKDLKV